MSELSIFASRYDLATSPDWQALLTHFDLSDGFAFIVLLVPNEEGAEVCRRALSHRLDAEGKKITDVDFSTPERLREIANALLLTDPDPLAGAVWASKTISEGIRTTPLGGKRGVEAWRREPAPQSVAAALYGSCNPGGSAVAARGFARECPRPVVGANVLVAWVDPPPLTSASNEPVRQATPTQRGPDPQLALEEAETASRKAGIGARAGSCALPRGFGFQRELPVV